MLLAVLFLGVLPRTWFGAVLLVLAGPLALILAQVVGELVIGQLARVPPVAGLNEWVHRRTEERRTSPLRIGIALLSVLLAGAIIGGAVILLSGTVVEQWVRAAGPFWNRHFR